MPNDDGFDENETEPASVQPVKKKRVVLTREFTEFDRWDRSDCTDEDILVFIRRLLDQCNMDAGIQHVPGKHNEGECLDVFKVYIVGRQIMEEDRTVLLTFANVWNLLNIFRAVRIRLSYHAMLLCRRG